MPEFWVDELVADPRDGRLVVNPSYSPELGILLVIEAKDDERFEAAAVRWAGRLALETPDLALAERARPLARGREGRASR